MADELERLREAAEELLDKLLAETAAREYQERHVRELTALNEKLQSLLRVRELEAELLRDRIAELEKSASDYLSLLEEMRKQREQWEKDR
jgi:protein-arginine kinase activator protein McsA